MSGVAEAFENIERFTGFPEPLHAGRMAKLRSWRRTRRELVLREDLRDLTRIRELGLIDQLAELLPERVGSPMSVNALREELGVAFDTVKGRLEALQRLYYLFELRPMPASSPAPFDAKPRSTCSTTPSTASRASSLPTRAICWR